MPDSNKFKDISEHFRAYLQKLNDNLSYEYAEDDETDKASLMAQENVRIAFEGEEDK